MTERRVTIGHRAPLRSLAGDVLILHTVLGAALAGRTSPDHAARAARRAHESARAEVFGRICPVCGRQLAARVWVAYKGAAYQTDAGQPIAYSRAYCSAHCTVVQLLREGFDFVPTPRVDVTDFDLVEP